MKLKTIAEKTDLMKTIETKLGGDIEEILRVLYVDKNLTVHQIKDELNISYKTTLKWLLLAGVYSKRLHITD